MHRLTLANYQRPHLVPPNNARQVLLHSCCAPCSGEVIQAIRASGIELTVFFYNPNIHPRQEYELRKAENIALCQRLDIDFYEGDYDADNWLARARGLEWEPERGTRCTVCFDMRFERAALFAHELGVEVFCSCLGISRWKNMEQINACGVRAASRYAGMVYWDFNWRKQGGAQRMIEIARQDGMYQQQYCGCVYSLRDSNLWRHQQGRKAISLGQDYYQTQRPLQHTTLAGATHPQTVTDATGARQSVTAPATTASRTGTLADPATVSPVATLSTSTVNPATISPATVSPVATLSTSTISPATNSPSTVNPAITAASQ